MRNVFEYAVPHALYHGDFIRYVTQQAGTRRTLVITASRPHATWLRQQFTNQPHAQIEVITLQTLLMKQLKRTAPRPVISATSRMVVVNTAWAQVGGALYQQFGHNRGALNEIAQALSWISSKRQRWEQIDRELDIHHEFAQTYARYAAILDDQGVIAYDDVALHVCDNQSTPLPYDLVVAGELQHASAAQLHALAHLIQPIDAVTLAGWVHAGHHAPELADVHNWLCQFSPPQPWPASNHHSGDLVAQRVLGQVTANPALTLIGMPSNTAWIAGVPTIVDECQAIALLAYQRLAAQRSVAIVCSDESLVPHVRAALIGQGIPLAPLVPPSSQNPLMQLGRGALRWPTVSDHLQQRAMLNQLLQLPFWGLSSAQARQASRDSANPHTEALTAKLNAVDIQRPIAPQISALIKWSNALMWAWLNNTIAVDVRDAWLRDYHSWLARIEEVDRIALSEKIAGAQREQLISSIESLPNTLDAMYRTTLPLTIHSRTGASANADCVIVMGMSEHVAPRSAFGYQLFREQTLCAAFVASHRPHPPLRTAAPASSEREERRLATLCGSHAHEVVFTMAHHSVNGATQLASPYFERILHGMARFTANGELEVTDTTNITRINGAAMPVAHHPAPMTTPVRQVMHDNSFSASQISNYLGCPRRYFYEKIVRISDDDDDDSRDERNLDTGNLIHEVLCAALGNGQTSDVDLRNESAATFIMTLAQLPQRTSQILAAAWQGEPVALGAGTNYMPTQRWSNRFGEGLRQRSSLRKIEQLLERWVTIEHALHKQAIRRPVLLEHQLSMTLNGKRINARIDRIDLVTISSTERYYEIIDYKTSKTKAYSDLLKVFLPKNDEKPTNYQIPLYLLGLTQPEWSLTPAATQMRMYYLGIPKPADAAKDPTRVTILGEQPTNILKQGNSHIGIQLATSDLHGTIALQLDRIMEQMRQTPYPTTPSCGCNYCPFALICDDAIQTNY
ncbi:MAG: PD-(D/E)XK nuclease family protein [Chloroflexales bacterium]|nr:PD-(D/E)XK nuclease family protein [Chloroflexales bacterium]